MYVIYKRYDSCMSYIRDMTHVTLQHTCTYFMRQPAVYTYTHTHTHTHTHWPPHSCSGQYRVSPQNPITRRTSSPNIHVCVCIHTQIIHICICIHTHITNMYKHMTCMRHPADTHTYTYIQTHTHSGPTLPPYTCTASLQHPITLQYTYMHMHTYT